MHTRWTFPLNAMARPFVQALLLVAACMALALGPTGPAEAATVGSGTAATETRSLPAFEAVTVAGSLDLQITQADSSEITLTADDNLLPLLETEVVDGRHGRTLQIRWRRDENVRTRVAVKIAVRTPTLTALSTAGSGDVVVNRMDTPSLRLSLSGSGDAALRQLKTGTLEIRSAGSGDVSAAGSATDLKLTIAGSADADLSALVADAVKISIAGSGDAQVVANRALDVSIAGSGDVRYSGNASDVRTSVAGSGSIRKQ